MDEATLQVDHRIPYEIGGEHDEHDIDYFMLLSPSAIRAKSWTCEHCPNWNTKDSEFCKTCFWAYPEKYEHIAGKVEKIVTLVFAEHEIDDYKKLIQLSDNETTAEATIKKLIHKHVSLHDK